MGSAIIEGSRPCTATTGDPATPIETTPQKSQQAAEQNVWGVGLKEGRVGGRKEALREGGALAASHPRGESDSDLSGRFGAHS